MDIEPDHAPAAASAVTAVLLVGFGFPATAVAAAFAFGGLEDVGKGFLVALAVWVGGVAMAWIHPFRAGAADDGDLPPAVRWGLGSLAVAALAAVVASSAPLLPWSLVLLVGPFFAWITGSLWVLAREERSASAG